MAIADFTHRESTAWVSGTATVLPTYPADVANGTTAADDVIYMTIIAKPETTTITPSGSWTLVEENTGGAGAAAADTGATKTGVWKRSVPGGGLNSTTTVTLTGASVAIGCMSSYRPVTPGNTPVWTEDVVTASLTSASTNMAATASGAPSIAIADGVHVAVTCASPSDAATTQPVSTIVASGATIGTPAVAPGSDFSAQGNDVAGSRYDSEVTAGTSSAAPSITGTAAASTTRCVIWQVIRLDQTPPNTNAPAGHASGTGAALDPTVNIVNGQPQAGHASGTGSAGAPTPSVAPHAEHAAGTGAAGTAKANVGAHAGHAAGTGAALAPDLSIDSNVPAGHAAGTGAALAATVSTEDPVGVPFLLAQLDGAQLAVEAAFGADLTADDATWDWTDISDFVRYQGGITLRHGRRDEAAKSQPASCRFTLDNRGGEFSRGGQATYWPYIRINTPVRVSIDPGDTGYETEFLGFADSWQPGWDSTGVNAVVELSASGTLRRLAQGTAPVLSPFRRATLDRADVVAYWPCEEPKNAQAIPSGLAGGTAMVLSGDAQYPYPKFAENDDFPCSKPLPEVNQTRWRGAVAPYTSTSGSAQLRFLAVFPEDPLSGTACILASLFTAGTATRWDIMYINAAGGSLKLFVTDTTGTITELSYTAFEVDNSRRWLALELTQDGADIDWVLRTCALGTRGSVAVSGTVAGETATRATAVAIGPDGDVADLAVGHVLVLDASGNFTADLDSFNAYDFEITTDRLQRLCDEAGVPITITGTSELRMGPQPDEDLVKLLRECETADGGLLYDGLANGLSYVTGAERVNSAAALTLDAAAGEAGGVEPIDDDQRVANQVTAKRSAGGEATYEDTDGELGTAAVGVYDDSIEVNIAYPDDLIDHASRRVALGTLPGYRYPRLQLALHRDPDLIPDWLATTLSDRVDVVDLPDVRTQLPAGDIALLLEGYEQRIDQFTWDIALNTSPYEPMRAGLWATDTNDTDTEFVQRCDVDPGGSVLASDAAAGAGTLSVTTTSRPLWTRLSQNPEDFPLDVDVGGIRITVTGISGSTSSQTFTVTGATVTRALPAGLAVSLWRPPGLGM